MKLGLACLARRWAYFYVRAAKAPGWWFPVSDSRDDYFIAGRHLTNTTPKRTVNSSAIHCDLSGMAAMSSAPGISTNLYSLEKTIQAILRDSNLATTNEHLRRKGQQRFESRNEVAGPVCALIVRQTRHPQRSDDKLGTVVPSTCSPQWARSSVGRAMPF